MPRRFLMVLLACGLALLLSAPGAVFAQGGATVEGLRSANEHVKQAITQVEAGDVAGAKASLAEFHEGWETVEDGVREQSRDTYAAIEGAYDEARGALAAGDAGAAAKALEELAHANKVFVEGPISFTPARSGTAVEGVRMANEHVEQALTQVEAGDIAGATASLAAFHDSWAAVEDGVREQSRDAYLAIEAAYDEARDSLVAGDAAAATRALEELEHTGEAFAAGRITASPAAAAASTSLEALLPKLTEASQALERGQAVQAAAELEEFRTAWPDVEGEVKARSADVYRSSENTMAAAAAAITAGDLAGARTLLDQLLADLTPMASPARYGVFDAFSILLREGLEALLVIAALLAFLARTGNQDKRGWIWGGGILGVVASVAAGLIIAVIFRGVATGSNRELIEGISGLIAAAMLFGVSFWLHGKSHAGAWQKYIRERTTAALATGSIASLGMLSFFAVFREGAETALFYIGIAPSIATGDLLLGIGIALAVLAVSGVLVLWVGVRLPLRPFFLVTSALIFYLGFKFIGTGIHALQVARLLPSSGAGFLPDLPALGIFPTWQTTLPQLVLLGVAVVVVVLEQVMRRPAATSQAA